MKKFLVISIFLTCLWINSSANPIEVNGVWYTVDVYNKYASVTKYKDTPYSGDIVISSSVEYEGTVYDVTYINDAAFSRCDKLRSVYIPSSITIIGPNSFYECTGLTSVHIEDLESWCNITFGTFENQEVRSNPLFYAHHLYLNNEEIQNLVIPQGVEFIKANLFNGCISIKNVTIPEGVTSIGESSFEGCTNLTSVKIPNSVNSIYKSAFRGCI